jgi:hypothetical protein
MDNYNFQDAFRILDSLGGYLAMSKYFKNEEIQDAFEQTDIYSKVDKIHALLLKYYHFLEHFSDIGVRLTSSNNIIATCSTKY